MTSRNSFLAKLIENAKRRLWLLVVSLLTFVVAIPTFTAMELSVISQRDVWIEQHMVQEKLHEFALNMYGKGNAFLFFLIGAFAIICGIQGFSYLYDRNKIDFYHSKPVKASARFLSIWTNGILVWLLPYLAGVLINLVLFAGYGILDTKIFANACVFLLLGSGLYLCMYHLAILALMMTGRLMVTCLAIAVFLGYEAAVRLLTGGFFAQFYRFFYWGDQQKWTTPAFSPVTYLVKYAEDEWKLGIALAALFAFAVVILGISYWCYKKRPTEMAGNAMAFSAVKPVIKIAIAVPIGLFAGLFTCDIVDYDPIHQNGSPGFPIFIGIMGILITCCLIQVIYEADIKGIFHKKIHIMISLVMAMCIALIFRFDLTGFDTRLPDEKDMEYVTMITDTGDRYGYGYLDDGLKFMDKETYVNKYMRLTGDTALAARNLAAHSIECYTQQTIDEFNQNYKYSYVVFHFYQKNGSVITRHIPVAVSEETNASYIKQIESSEEFIMVNESAMSEELMEVLKSNNYKITASWGNNIFNTEMSRKQARELLELYRMDLLNDSYAIKTKEMPIGEFSIYIDAQVSYSRELNFLVYPSFANSVKYLKDNGFKIERYIPLEDIERIYVSRNVEQEKQDEMYYEEYTYSSTIYGEYAVAEELQMTSEVYSDPVQIQEILENAYPGFLNYEWWYIRNPMEEEYEIRVYFKEGTSVYEERGYSVYFNFLKGQVPAFVAADLAEEKTE